jgi:hypothetical protein
MARYAGRKGVVYMSTSAAGAAANVINLNAWNINFSTDKIDVTSFGDPNKVYVQGLKDVQGSISGFWSDTDDTLFDAADSADGVRLYLYPSSDAPTIYFYGPAWVDASIDTGVGDAVTMSADFSANGAWGRKP